MVTASRAPVEILEHPSASGFRGGLEFSAVSKQFDGQLALENVTFTLPRGSATALVGPNGAGKTTLIKLLLGLARPSSGAVLIDGEPPQRLSPVALRVGAMTEALGLDADLGPQSFLRGIARILGLDPAAADRALELVGAAAFAKKRIGRLSLGMRQRVRLALALLPDAPYLVLDEPQNGLDPDGIEWLYDFLAGERAAGRTLLVATHHLDEVERLADACVMLHRTVRYAGPASSGLSTLYHRFR